MDEIDQKLIAQLRQNSRESIATLAARLKVARGTIKNRMARLEREGVIAGYTLRLRPDVQTDQIKAWMSIAVDGNRTREVNVALMGEMGVASLVDTNGRWDLLAEIRADDLQGLAQVLERVRLLKGISNTETSIHLQTYRLS